MKTSQVPTLDDDYPTGPPVMSIDEARERIDHIAGIMDPEKRSAESRRIREVLEREYELLEGRKQHAREQLRRLEMRREVLDELESWANKPPVLERNDCSRIHNLRDAAATRRLFLLKDRATAVEEIGACAEYIDAVDQTFVICHDWARAFENADSIEGEYNLPYQCCSFEFRISGRTMILILVDCSLGRQIGLFGQFGEVWLHIAGKNDADHPMVAFMLAQVRAICIALDAEVATSEVVRAPVKLNEKRAKAGKAPLPDYRVVDLARRHRIANPVGGTGTGTKKRLHFRRGHWRHFETSKTWVKWCLVGNPDLGFINKHYRL